MPKAPPKFERYGEADDGDVGFSAIAVAFWRTAEKLRHEAEKETEGKIWRTHWSVPSVVCLHHASLECFVNEEITLSVGLKPPEEKLLTKAYRLQGETLHAEKIAGFWSFFGLADKAAPDVNHRVALLTKLRNRLYHHWPIFTDLRDYPADVIAALNDAQIEKVNTSWIGQCGDVRLAAWSGKVVHDFVCEWWRIGRPPDKIARLHWDYGPDWRYPTES